MKVLIVSENGACCRQRQRKETTSADLLTLLSHSTTKQSAGKSPLNTWDHAGICVVGAGSERQKSVSLQETWLV